MRPVTKQIKSRIRDLDSIRGKLAFLENAYLDEPCYMLATGPSLGAIWNDDLKDFLSDKLVIAVKQAYDLAPEIMDFHLLNPWNYQPYDYKGQEPIILASKGDKDPETPGMEPDLLFHVPEPSNWEKRLATTFHFDKYLFSKTLNRPWGPGIVYELGFYLMIHLGVKEIITLGWDLGDVNSPTMEHFFHEESATSKKSDGVANKPRIRGFEVADIANSTPAAYYWLRSKGINLYVASDRSMVDPVVPRISIFDVDRSRWGYKTELVGNGDLSLWTDQGPAYWDLHPGPDYIRRAVDDRDGSAAAELSSGHSDRYTGLFQTVKAERFFRGAKITISMDAKADVPGGTGFVLAFMTSSRDPKPIMIRQDHPGDGQWHTLTAEAEVPSDIDVAYIKFTIMHRLITGPLKIGEV